MHDVLGSAEEARSLRALVAEMEEALKRKMSKVRATHRTNDTAVVAEQECVECAERTTRIAKPKGGLYKLEGKLEILEHRNNVSDPWNSMQSDECALLKR